jgi:hypothetical protein
MKPIVPTDITLIASKTENRKFPNANYYITLRHCDQHGEEKASFYWNWTGTTQPTVADVLMDFAARVKAVVGFTTAQEWISATHPRGTVETSRLPELISDFISRKRMERKLRRFLGPKLQGLLDTL